MSILDINVPAWMADAACNSTDPEIFYPKDGSWGFEAKAICRRCDVTTTCLAFALEIEEGHTGSRWGVYGGTTARERRAIAAKRKKASA